MILSPPSAPHPHAPATCEVVPNPLRSPAHADCVRRENMVGDVGRKEGRKEGRLGGLFSFSSTTSRQRGHRETSPELSRQFGGSRSRRPCFSSHSLLARSVSSRKPLSPFFFFMQPKNIPVFFNGFYFFLILATFNYGSRPESFG